MVIATFRFYEELNEFLPANRRKRSFESPCARAATVKHMIEALGVPHTEVEIVLVNGVSVGFGTALRHGDRVAVYPKFETLDISPLLRVRGKPLRTPRFIADAHLGGLAHLLRMAGFDTLYDNHFDDGEIEVLASRQDRIVLTRDRELLKRRTITHGCYVHAIKPEPQLRQIFERLDLIRSARPFSLCLRCNVALQDIEKAQVLDRLPPNVRAVHQRFSICPICSGVFWEGTHWQRMRALLDRITEGLAPASSYGPDS